MFKNLTARIFAIFWFTLALVIIAVLFIPKLDTRTIKDISLEDSNLAIDITGRIEKIIEQQTNHNVLWLERLSRILTNANTQEFSMFLVNNEGRLIGVKRREMDSVRNFIGLSNDINEPKKKRYADREFIGPFMINDDSDIYLLYIIRKMSDTQPIFVSQLFDEPILLLLGVMLISTPLLLWLSWSIARPARKLKYAADQVAQGNLTLHPELEQGPVEFRAAGRSFNHMVEAVEKMMNVQHRLLSDISHELRTPLTRLQLASALMRRKQGDSEELSRIETETRRLDIMINELLELSRKQYTDELNREVTTAEELWSGVIDDAQFEAEQKNKKFVVRKIAENWQIHGTLNSLESAVENIIRNALRYSYNLIEVEFNADEKGIWVIIDDDGPGVKDEELEHLFRPFYRTDEARARESGGKGLGLAIVEAVAKQHQGWVKAERSPLGGLRMTIWFARYYP